MHCFNCGSQMQTHQPLLSDGTTGEILEQHHWCTNCGSLTTTRDDALTPSRSPKYTRRHKSPVVGLTLLIVGLFTMQTAYIETRFWQIEKRIMSMMSFDDHEVYKIIKDR